MLRLVQLSPPPKSSPSFPLARNFIVEKCKYGHMIPWLRVFMVPSGLAIQSKPPPYLTLAPIRFSTIFSPETLEHWPKPPSLFTGFGWRRPCENRSPVRGQSGHWAMVGSTGFLVCTVVRVTFSSGMVPTGVSTVLDGNLL